jgi:hypothetical protein
MNSPGRYSETYRAFLEFVGNDVQRERHRANRRMLSVFLWCFLVPAIMTVIILLLVKIGWLPRRARANVDWLILIFPVLYSVYILGSEVLTGIPSIFRRGGLATSLKQAQTEGEWRDRACETLRSQCSFSLSEWEWVIQSFRIDLEKMMNRTKYLTALAGAVFFLVMQGIDSLTDAPETAIRNPLMLWLEASNGISQLMALALFLVLLYLSGNQTYHSLLRYLNCAELVVLQNRGRDKI